MVVVVVVVVVAVAVAVAVEAAKDGSRLDSNHILSNGERR